MKKGVKRIQINISNKAFYTFVLISTLLVFGAVVYAYGGNNPSSVGHSVGELEGVCRSDGLNCNFSVQDLDLDLEIVINEVFSSTTQVDVTCPAGKRVLSGGCEGSSSATIIESMPISGSSWRCRWNTAGSGYATRAICANVVFD